MPVHLPQGPHSRLAEPLPGTPAPPHSTFFTLHQGPSDPGYSRPFILPGTAGVLRVLPHSPQAASGGAALHPSAALAAPSLICRVPTTGLLGLTKRRPCRSSWKVGGLAQADICCSPAVLGASWRCPGLCSWWALREQDSNGVRPWPATQLPADGAAHTVQGGSSCG